MNKEISDSKRGVVVAIDASVKASVNSTLYDVGIELQENQPSQDLTNIFVRKADGEVYYAESQSGNSTWIDFLNKNAQQYWGSQFSYDNFKGQEAFYQIWNDMNEPAILKTASATLPSDI